MGTLVSEDGQALPAHRLILSSCSVFFDTLLSSHGEGQGHPLIVLPASATTLAAILAFIHIGEAEVEADQLDSFIQTASLLRLTGLSELVTTKQNINEEVRSTIQQECAISKSVSKEHYPSWVPTLKVHEGPFSETKSLISNDAEEFQNITTSKSNSIETVESHDTKKEKNRTKDLHKKEKKKKKGTHQKKKKKKKKK